MTEDLELFSGKSESKFSIKDFGYKCLANWHIFIVCLLACVGAAFLYLRFAVPKYSASTLILIKGKTASSKGDLVDNAITGTLNPDFDFNNELQLLHSGSLIERVVLKNEFNISYYLLGKFQKRDIYLDAPFRLIPQSIRDSSTPVSIIVEKFDNSGGIIEYGAKKEKKRFVFKWNRPFITTGKTFILARRDNNVQDNGQKYLAEWLPIKSTTDEILSKYTVSRLNKSSSIINLDIKIENLFRGTEILNAIAREYDLSDIEDRTIITRNTLRFIDDRLLYISNQLSGVEGNLENYRGRNNIVDLATQQSQSFGGANNVSQNLKDIKIRQEVVQMIRNYFNNPATENKAVPSTMGLDDATLSNLISKYNDLQLTKQRQAPLVAANSTVMEDLNNQVNNVRGSILEALENISKNLRLQENNYQQQNGQYQQFLSSLPGKERAMQEIKRKQSITEGLYLYLLQKREEAAISSTSATISNYKQIEPAKGGGLVEPNVLNVELYSVLLGFLLPVAWVFFKDILNDRISSRSDVTAKLNVPFIGDINHITTKIEESELVILDRNIIAEQFRILRTNLSLLLKKKENQVILVTSSVSGEGKSFISANVAGVLAIPGKKVALLEFDLRKSEQENIPFERKGLTNFLADETTALAEIYIASKKVPSLHIYSSGAVTSNPGDLMLNGNIANLIYTLKQQYDYIVIDSAPVGLVSDAFVLGEYSDLVLYVIRQRITEKKQLDYLNDVISQEKFSNIALVLNDVKIGGKYGYYGYGSVRDYGQYTEPKKSILPL